MALDDPWMGPGEYHAEIGRRIWFAGPLAELRVPTHGSGGYDWTHQIDIWFDSVAHGLLGASDSFTGVHPDSDSSRRHAAVYAGLARISRRTTVSGSTRWGGARLGATTGARSSSWSQIENGPITDTRRTPAARAPLRSHVAEVPGPLATTAQVVGAHRGRAFEAGELELRTADGEAEVTIYALSGHSHIQPEVPRGAAAPHAGDRPRRRRGDLDRGGIPAT